MQMQNFEKHVWAEIDLDALRANFRTVKQRAGSLPLCAVVKADSYGHGAVQCARVFAQEGASWLAVSCLAEALQLRRSGQTLPILILGHVQPTYAAALIRDDITAACYSLPQAKALSEAAQAAGGRVKVHLAVDTGMGRIGFALRTDFDAAIAEAIAACTLPGLEMTGLFQHFSVADDTAEENISYTAEQHRLFVQACSALTAAGHEPGIVHCDNSAGVMLHPDWPEGLPRAHCMARPGIILYGFDPSDEVRFNGEVIHGEKHVYILMNKPKGYVTSLEDPHADKTVMDLVRNACTERVYPVGRLDKNSVGVLLITNDGDLTRQLTHPSYKKSKIYQVSLDKPLSEEDMQRIADGIELEDGMIYADEVSYVSDSRKEIGIEIHSGRNRIVRRIFEALGYSVQKLDRVYFAGLTKKGLKRGAWRFLTPREVSMLKSGEYE